MNNSNLKSPTRILITGEGGQGIQTIAKILSEAADAESLKIIYMPHYGVEMRMGISLAYVQISNKEITGSKFSHADILAITAKRDLDLLKNYLLPDTIVVNCTNSYSVLQENNLSSRTLNMLCLGIIIKELNEKGIKISQTIVQNILQKNLGHKKGLEENLKAFILGLQLDKEKYSQLLDQVVKDKFEPVIFEDDKKTHINFPNLCKGCGLCLEQCPVKALSWSKDKLNYISRPIPEVNLEKCIACGICEQVCPDCAIKITKNK